MRFKARLAPEQATLLYNLVTPISRLNGGTASSSHDSSSLLSPGGGGTVIHLDPDHIRISTRGGGSLSSTSSGNAANDSEGISCFAELATENGIFLDHRIESAANNVIVFEIDLVHLRTALQSILASGKNGGSFASVTVGRGNTQPLYNSAADDGVAATAANVVSFTPSIVVMKLAKRNGGIPCLCLDAVHAGGGRGNIEVHHAIPIRIMRAVEMQYHVPPRINMPDVQLELPNDRPLRTVVERLRSMSPHG